MNTSSDDVASPNQTLDIEVLLKIPTIQYI